MCDYIQTDPLEAYIWCPSDFVMCTFTFVEFALYPHAVINLSCEYSYIESHGTPPSMLPNLGLVLRLLFLRENIFILFPFLRTAVLKQQALTSVSSNSRAI